MVILYREVRDAWVPWTAPSASGLSALAEGKCDFKWTESQQWAFKKIKWYIEQLPFSNTPFQIGRCITF